MTALLIASLLVALFSAAVLLAGKRRWQEDEDLGLFEAGAGWLAYFAHAGLVIWANLIAAWPLADPGALSFALGGTLITIGAAIYAAGVLAFRSLQQVQGTDSGALVTSGIYRYSRHPQNTGWGIALAGVALLGLSGFALLLAALYWLAMLFYFRIEERRVEATFGDEYRRWPASNAPRPRKALRRTGYRTLSAQQRTCSRSASGQRRRTTRGRRGDAAPGLRRPDPLRPAENGA